MSLNASPARRPEIRRLSLAERLAIVLVSGIVPFLLIHTALVPERYDRLAVYTVLAAVLPIGLFFLRRSLGSVLIPYCCIQLIFILVFLEQVFLEPFGLRLKIYAMAFGIASLAAARLTVRHFGFLWREYPLFKWMLLFTLINLSYLLFNSTDFRTFYSHYYDIWTSQGYNKALALKEGFQVNGKDFEETGFITTVLTAICPMIPLAVSLTLFREETDRAAVVRKVWTIVRIVTISLAAYFALSLMGLGLGLSHIAFVDGQMKGNVLGLRIGSENLMSVVLLLLFVLSGLLNTIDSMRVKRIYRIVLPLLIVVCFGWILLPVKKTPLIALALAGISFVGLKFLSGKSGEPTKQTKIISGGSLPSFRRSGRLVPLALLAVGLMAWFGMHADEFPLLSKFIERFSSSHTLGQRETVWNYFVADWLSNLTPLRLLFGFGIDASRYLTFYISSMQPSVIGMLPSTHNIYLQIFYEYGILGWLYFMGFIGTMIKNIRILFSEASPEARLCANASISLLVYFLVYYYSESPILPILFVTYCTMGLLEALTSAYRLCTNTPTEDVRTTDAIQSDTALSEQDQVRRSIRL